MPIRTWGITVLLGCGLGGALLGQSGGTFAVRHDHDPWGDCRGVLKIASEGIEFESKKAGHSRRWRWTDIQDFDRLAPNQLRILSWEDRFWFPLSERFFNFRLEGEEALEGELMALVEASLTGTRADRVPPPIEVLQQFPVKHRHAVGGCQGLLQIGADRIVFASEEPRHSRSWRLDRDISSFWSSHPYELELRVFEQNEREFQRLKRFQFDLKQELPAALYRELRRSTAGRSW